MTGRVAGSGGDTGCQTDGGLRKTMSKRYRRSQSGREITQAQSKTLQLVFTYFIGKKYKAFQTFFRNMGPECSRGGESVVIGSG